MEDLETRIEQVFEIAKKAESEINSHTRECSIRYQWINDSVQSLEKAIKEIAEAMRNDLNKIKSDVNKYVISTLVFSLLSVGSFASYLWMKLDDEQHNRVTSTQVDNIQKSLNGISTQVDDISKKANKK